MLQEQFPFIASSVPAVIPGPAATFSALTLTAALRQEAVFTFQISKLRLREGPTSFAPGNAAGVPELT